MYTINAYVKNEHYQTVDFDKFNIVISIDNDTKDAVSVTAYSVYVNGKGYPFEYTKALQRRDKIELHISEVLRDAVVNANNTHAVFGIMK
jgi:hypothetical protein